MKITDKIFSVRTNLLNVQHMLRARSERVHHTVHLYRQESIKCANGTRELHIQALSSDLDAPLDLRLDSLQSPKCLWMQEVTKNSVNINVPIVFI